MSSTLSFSLTFNWRSRVMSCGLAAWLKCSRPCYRYELVDWCTACGDRINIHRFGTVIWYVIMAEMVKTNCDSSKRKHSHETETQPKKKHSEGSKFSTTSLKTATCIHYLTSSNNNIPDFLNKNSLLRWMKLKHHLSHIYETKISTKENEQKTENTLLLHGMKQTARNYLR